MRIKQDFLAVFYQGQLHRWRKHILRSNLVTSFHRIIVLFPSKQIGNIKIVFKKPDTRIRNFVTTGDQQKVGCVHGRFGGPGNLTCQ